MLVGCSAWISMSPTKGPKNRQPAPNREGRFWGRALGISHWQDQTAQQPRGFTVQVCRVYPNRKTCSRLGFSYICCSFWIPGFGRSISLPQKYSPSHGHNFITEPAQKWLVDINPGRNVPQTVPNSNQCPILAVIFKMLLRAT